MTFTFSGNSIVYHFTKAYNRGMAAITIDGVDKGLVDLYSPSIQYQQSIGFAGLGPGIHTIHISVSGQKYSASTDYYIDVDSLTIFFHNLAQVWGMRDVETGSYGGTDTYMTTPDPSIIFSWSDGPTGPTYYTSPPFIESGPTKDCTFGCGSTPHHPYASWNDVYGNYGEHVDTSVVLAANGWYRYKNYFIGSNLWEAQWCSAVGCYVLADPNLSTSSGMPYIASGGESSCSLCSIGTITTSNEQWWDIYRGVWSPWCYSATHVNVAGGTISACGTNQDWTVSY